MAPRDPSRVESIQNMRFVQNRTLKEIGDHYGITRERVRQILGNTGHEAYRARIQEKVSFIENSKDKTTVQLVNALNKKFGKGIAQQTLHSIRAKFRHAIADGLRGKGTEIENLVAKKLTSLGIKNTLMPHNHPFDIQLPNGRRIDVKSTFREARTSPSQRHTMYHFSIGKDTRGNYCDFFICYIEPTNDFFVIPNHKLGMVNSLYISWPTPERNWAGWDEYHNRWELLR